MITVPWIVDTYNNLSVGQRATDAEFIGKFYYTLHKESWVEFLFEHQTKITVKSYYDPATMLHNVDFQFYLPPEQETMYRLRFN